jgi:folylpolyglutamate synthase/dihydropteroate synthase
MLKQISNLADSILVTTFHTTSQDFNHKSAETSALTDIARKFFSGNIFSFESVEECIKYALEYSRSTPIIITGSLYLVGEAKHYLSNIPPQ